MNALIRWGWENRPHIGGFMSPTQSATRMASLDSDWQRVVGLGWVALEHRRGGLGEAGSWAGIAGGRCICPRVWVAGGWA